MIKHGNQYPYPVITNSYVQVVRTDDKKAKDKNISFLNRFERGLQCRFSVGTEDTDAFYGVYCRVPCLGSVPVFIHESINFKAYFLYPEEGRHS